MHFQETWWKDGRTDGRQTDYGKKFINPFFLKKAGKINRYDFNQFNTSVVLLLNIYLNISAYGQDASTGRTFLHLKTPKYFQLKTILLFHMLT